MTYRKCKHSTCGLCHACTVKTKQRVIRERHHKQAYNKILKILNREENLRVIDYDDGNTFLYSAIMELKEIRDIVEDLI